MGNASSRVQATETTILTVMQQVHEKLISRLGQKGFGCFVSSHEALGIVAEEYHELVDAVGSNRPEKVDHEMLDIAVAAVFALVSRQSGGMSW
jgi:hypothetical protein